MCLFFRQVQNLLLDDYTWRAKGLDKHGAWGKLSECVGGKKRRMFLSLFIANKNKKKHSAYPKCNSGYQTRGIFMQDMGGVVVVVVFTQKRCIYVSKVKSWFLPSHPSLHSLHFALLLQALFFAVSELSLKQIYKTRACARTHTHCFIYNFGWHVHICTHLGH